MLLEASQSGRYAATREFLPSLSLSLSLSHLQPQRMEGVAAGHYRGNLTLPEGSHHYKFIVDGQRSHNCSKVGWQLSRRVVVHSSPPLHQPSVQDKFGGFNNLIDVGPE